MIDGDKLPHVADISAIVGAAGEDAAEALKMEMEINGYAGPGGPSYSEEDTDAMAKEITEFSNLGMMVGIGYKVLALSPDAAAVLAGLIALSDEADPERGVNHQGIFSELIDQLQESLPVDLFWARAQSELNAEQSGGLIEYNPDAGL